MERREEDDLTPTEINIAIAEACGWTDIRTERHPASADLLWTVGSLGAGTHGILKPIPDYYHDLNAMHEVEIELPIGKRADFRQVLKNLPEPLCDKEILGWDAIHATAHQRAEAFLRVKGLWKEEGKE
jgi:hypothetical protein